MARTKKRKKRLTALQQNIKQLRVKLGLSQTDLALKLGLVEKSSVSHWETGDSHPRSGLVPKLAEALHTTVGELYTEAV